MRTESHPKDTPWSFRKGGGSRRPEDVAEEALEGKKKAMSVELSVRLVRGEISAACNQAEYPRTGD